MEDDDKIKNKKQYTKIIDSNTQIPHLIGETPYRFVIVILYFFINFCNGMQWVTFASIADRFKIVYDLNQFQVDMFSLIYMILYPLFNFPASYTIDNKNLRLGVIYTNTDYNCSSWNISSLS
jgi:hypothetical protein